MHANNKPVVGPWHPFVIGMTLLVDAETLRPRTNELQPHVGNIKRFA